MSHGITDNDSMFSVREVPWHGLGAVPDRRPGSIAEAIALAGLGWRVEQRPVFMAGAEGGESRRLIEGYRANVRADTGEVLGLVGDSYTVVQNAEAFAFLSDLIGSALHFETAGSLFGGRHVWVLSELPDHLSVAGDAVRQFVLVSTRHDGTAAVRARVTPVRVVCNNTLTAALSGNRDGTYRVRHLENASVRIHEARAVMAMTVDYGRQFARAGDRLGLQPMSERSLAAVLEALYPTGTSERQSAGARRRREEVVGLFRDGATVGNAPGSKWSAWNAIVEHHQHVRPARTDQSRFIRAMDDPTGFAGRALELVTAA